MVALYYLHLRALIRLANLLQVWELVLQVWCHLVAVIQPFARLILLHEWNLLVAITHIFDPAYTMTSVSNCVGSLLQSKQSLQLHAFLAHNKVFDMSTVQLNTNVISASYQSGIFCSSSKFLWYDMPFSSMVIIMR